MNKGNSDQEIIERIKSADRKVSNNALKEIYLANVKLVEQYIMNHGGSQEDAADTYQDAVMVFYNLTREDRFEGKSSISTFIYSVARNIWSKKMRHLVKQRNLKVVDFERLPEQDLPKNEIDLQLILKGVMEQMGSDCKDLLTYFYYEKLSMSDIMEKFGLGSTQAAKNKKLRCVKKLMQLFKKNGITKENLFE
ncbi:MAG: sigma-70 family RNA polymerase sigma factor [Bacteroidota bacterium]